MIVILVKRLHFIFKMAFSLLCKGILRSQKTEKANYRNLPNPKVVKQFEELKMAFKNAVLLLFFLVLATFMGLQSLQMTFKEQ